MEIFEFFCGMNDEDGSNVIRKYEDCFIIVCENVIILKSNFFEFIIVGEKMKLDEFMLFVIMLVFKCNFRFLKKYILYKDILENIKNKINEKRVIFFENNGSNVILWKY